MNNLLGFHQVQINSSWMMWSVMCTFPVDLINSPFHSSLTIHSNDSYWSSLTVCNDGSSWGDPISPPFPKSVDRRKERKDFSHGLLFLSVFVPVLFLSWFTGNNKVFRLILHVCLSVGWYRSLCLDVRRCFSICLVHMYVSRKFPLWN